MIRVFEPRYPYFNSSKMHITVANELRIQTVGGCHDNTPTLYLSSIPYTSSTWDLLPSRIYMCTKLPFGGRAHYLPLYQFYSICKYLYQNDIRTRERSNVEMNLAQRDFAARSGLKMIDSFTYNEISKDTRIFY